MKLFKLKPEIHKFDKFKEFTEEFNIGEKDIILVNNSIYDKFIKKLNLKCTFLSPKKYGNGEPTDEIIDKVIEEASKSDYTRVIAIGGGAVMDIAKFLVLKGKYTALDIFERKIDFIKGKEFIAIPTTCGTGSEVTSFSVAEIKSKETKMGIGIDEFLPDQAILIPELLSNLPYKFFAFSTLDAIVHAAESFVSPRSNPYTELFAKEAITLILKGYKKIAEKGKEFYLEIIEDFLIGSNYAGIAFGNTSVGAVHALSYPLGGKYHVAHGECNYQFFTPVFKAYTEIASGGKIKEFNELVASILELNSTDNVYSELDSLLSTIWEKQKLNSFGMEEGEVVEFTDSVMEKQQRLLSNNYVPLSRDNIIDIYSNLY